MLLESRCCRRECSTGRCARLFRPSGCQGGCRKAQIRASQAVSRRLQIPRGSFVTITGKNGCLLLCRDLQTRSAGLSRFAIWSTNQSTEKCTHSLIHFSCFHVLSLFSKSISVVITARLMTFALGHEQLKSNTRYHPYFGLAAAGSFNVADRFIGIWIIKCGGAGISMAPLGGTLNF